MLITIQFNILNPHQFIYTSKILLEVNTFVLNHTPTHIEVGLL